jgi:integrase/recombinase XerD
LEDVRAFQVHLVSTGISWPALNQIVCALRFFYGVTLGEALIPERIPYAREPRKLPVVLSADEVVQFLEAVSSLKSRAALTTAYPAGLRASEVAGLRIEDIDSARGVIQVRHGKGANSGQPFHNCNDESHGVRTAGVALRLYGQTLKG